MKRRRKIEVVPRLFPIIMSCKKPVKNKITLDGFILNFTIHKYITIDIKLGFEILNIEKKLKDICNFNTKNKKTKNNMLIENL